MRRNFESYANKSTSSEIIMTVRETQAAEPQIAQAPVRTIHKIVKYGDPVLEKPGATIKKFDAQLEQLAEDMFATMYASQGVGLAAPQIGRASA